MTTFSQKIKDLSDIDFPEGLHGKIMRRLVFLKFRTPFLIVVGLLLLNLLVSAMRLSEVWSEFGSSTVLSFLFSDIDFSLSSFGDAMRTAYEVIPAGWGAIFLLNLFVLAYVVYFPVALSKYQRTK